MGKFTLKYIGSKIPPHVSWQASTPYLRHVCCQEDGLTHFSIHMKCHLVTITGIGYEEIENHANLIISKF